MRLPRGAAIDFAAISRASASSSMLDHSAQMAIGEEAQAMMPSRRGGETKTVFAGTSGFGLTRAAPLASRVR
jgi:hypothetical protein